MATEARQVMCRQPAGEGDDSLQSSGLVQTRPECRISIAWFSSFVAKAGNLHMCWTLPVFVLTQFFLSFPVAQMVKNLPAMQKTQV